MTADDTLDTIGLLCPLPVLKARKRLKGLGSGAVLRVLTSDPAALVDIPHFCHESGHALLETQDMPDGTHAFLIRRA
ncbi:MAG: tRNA 2-thiouridine synthesizing protein TusA [Roseibaca calidilacus]|uniref:tRNA 2-thiouridine synthesizing protein A n=1 Tax=Roseibaca calidilacus TaxID=1666912 RepID=A0A0P7YTZ5_9RHOB|nr:sulfurtransferase TusA family protein [Roseibaca calidilacus]KPP92831.1 MAG: tRNA 2-thiouridine synthesizing protein TusA [Roseibaca calidilacus]CUX80097.1 tRNA 2-thiouridine synthesizing protein A [Roseibaca calidilacus]